MPLPTLSRVLRSLTALMLVAFCGAPLPAQEDQAKQRSLALGEIRAAAGARDMAAMNLKLADGTKLKGEEKFDAELARLDELCEYLEKFWGAVDKGAKSLDGTEELMIGEQLVAFVEYENGTLVLRVQGQNRQYTQKSLPPKIALTLAQLIMKPEAAANKIFFGSFLVLDSKGDPAQARKMWDEAAAGGIDVKHLLPELEAERPLPPVEIPPLSVAMRNLLAEKNWSLRVKGEKGWVRRPLEKSAEQTEEGRLVLRHPADATESIQIVNKRAMSGDFSVRLILQNVQKGQTLGLFAADGQEVGYVVQLPAGTMFIKFGRQAGELKCLIAGKPSEIKPLGKATPRMAGILAITLPPGTECTLAAWEFAGQ